MPVERRPKEHGTELGDDLGQPLKSGPAVFLIEGDYGILALSRSCGPMKPLGSTAGCGKPHVRWCGREQGRNALPRPDHLTRDLQVYGSAKTCAGKIASHKQSKNLA